MRKSTFKLAAVGLLALLFVLAVTDAAWPEGDMDQVSNEDVGNLMFGETEAEGYGIVVFLIGLLLLVAMLGGVFLAKEEEE
ncbi:MAG: NADH-quinone oxidoreductase subunit J [Thermoplasmata archaeon]|nr:NADH-quinone oxidoreductase subunit J [Thermoplasmata archaeon]